MKFDRHEMKIEVVRGSCGFFCSACGLMCSDEERVWWKCDTLYFGSLAIVMTMDHAMGFAGGSILAFVMKCEHECEDIQSGGVG